MGWRSRRRGLRARAAGDGMGEVVGVENSPNG